MEDATGEFWGEYEHSVDDKGRVVIPQDFRGLLGDRFIVTRGPDRSILVLPSSVWQPIQESLRNPTLHRDRAFLQRMLGGRTEVSLDPQARLAIPKHLREHAGISNSVAAVIVGQGFKFEIWSKPVWDEFTTRFTSENMFAAAEAAGLSQAISR